VYDGERHVVPHPGVLVMRATERVEHAAVVERIERDPRGRSVDRLAVGIERGIVNEDIWLASRAA
jgi:hypothetical protein